MSKPPVDLSTIVKAYDVRGVVPDQFDERIAAALGAAFVDVTGAGRLVMPARLSLARGVADRKSSRKIGLEK